MAQNLDSKVRAKVWLTPVQIDDLRWACYSTGADYLQQRNEAIIALMYDTGLRVGELVALDELDNGIQRLNVPCPATEHRNETTKAIRGH